VTTAKRPSFRERDGGESAFDLPNVTSENVCGTLARRANQHWAMYTAVKRIFKLVEPLLRAAAIRRGVHMPFPKWSIALRFSPTAFLAGLAMLALAATLIPRPALAAGYDVAGSYQLVSSSTKHLETGETVPDENAKGSIMYGSDGRMLVLITYGDRPKAESSAKLTDHERIQLFRTMLAYGGTYEFDGKTMTHHVDICADEVRCGSNLVREVTVDGDRLIYTTRPQPSPVDGKMIVITLIWQKLR
jgi:hypothetical protein